MGCNSCHSYKTQLDREQTYSRCGQSYCGDCGPRRPLPRNIWTGPSTVAVVSKFDGKIPIRVKIRNWYLDTKTNYIWGSFQPTTYNFELFGKGLILGYIDNVVIARARQNQIYAFILSGLDKSHRHQRREFYNYLLCKKLQPEIIF